MSNMTAEGRAFSVGQAYGTLYQVRTALIDVERILLALEWHGEVAELTAMGRRLREIQQSLRDA
jgi:hypothetical protein